MASTADSRLGSALRRRSERSTRCGYMERVFCLNCGKEAGLVTRAAPVVYVCSRCTGRYGEPPLPVIAGTEQM